MNRWSRGFTLIELMVVIAIIGVISAIVLATLTAPTAKSKDANIKANLHTIQSEAEVYYYNNNNSYGPGFAIGSGVCPTTGNFMFVNDTIIAKAIAAAASASGASVYCQSSNTAWVVWASLKVGVGGNMYWCVDSTGIAKSESTNYNPLAPFPTNYICT